MLHCRDDIGQVMNSAWFLPGMTLGIQTKDFNLCFISPKNFVPHGRRVLQMPFGKLVLLRSDYSVSPLCHTGVICGVLQEWLISESFSSLHRAMLRALSDHWIRGHLPEGPSILIAQVGRAVSSRKCPGDFKFLQFMDDGGHCAHWDLQCSRNFSVPFPRSVPWYNFQIMFNQLNLPQVDSSQVVETSDRWWVEAECAGAQFSVSLQRLWIYIFVIFLIFNKFKANFVYMGICV